MPAGRAAGILLMVRERLNLQSCPVLSSSCQEQQFPPGPEVSAGSPRSGARTAGKAAKLRLRHHVRDVGGNCCVRNTSGAGSSAGRCSVRYRPRAAADFPPASRTLARLPMLPELLSADQRLAEDAIAPARPRARPTARARSDAEGARRDTHHPHPADGPPRYHVTRPGRLAMT